MQLVPGGFGMPLGAGMACPHQGGGESGASDAASASVCLMSIRWYTVVVDCRDVVAQSRWWAEALDWRVAYQAADEVVLVPPHALDQTRVIPPSERGPGLIFVPVPEGKAVKNRLHIDLAPSPDTGQEAEVRRLEDLGASHVDIGQGQVSWVIMADPEGNEFCVLSARE
jgi:hypothetical protein